MKLKHQEVLEIIPTFPFNFNLTFYKPDHFPSRDCFWEPGKRWQTMLWRGEKLGLICRDFSKKGNPKIKVKVFSAKSLPSGFYESLKTEIIWRFNLDLDLKSFYQKAEKDSILAPIIRKFSGLRPMHAGSLYEYLIIGVVLQNAAVKRSVSMLQALFEKYGTLLEYENQKLWCFWEPWILASIREEELRSLKVGYRAKSLIKVSQPFATGAIDELKLRKEDKEKQEKILLSLYGVGSATLNYIMIDVFHHWDYLNHISPWEQKIYTKIFFNKDWKKGLVPVEEMLKFFERWGKWKALAVHYVWEDIWWKRKNEHISWLEELVRL